MSETTRVDVHVANLRKLGYTNLKQWLENPNHIYVGRAVRYVEGTVGHPLANPFVAKKYGTERCVELYTAWLQQQDVNEILKLKGKVLGCWCGPNDQCHAQVIIDKINSL